MIDSTSIKYQYERDGVAHIPEVFQKYEMDNLRLSALYGLGHSSHDAKYTSGDRVQEISAAGQTFPAIHFWPSVSSLEMEVVRQDHRIKAIVQAILGDDVKQLNNQLYYRMPGDGDCFDWHQDCVFRKGMTDGFDPMTDYLQTIITVDPMHHANGGLCFKPGAYKLGDQAFDRESLRSDPDPESLTGAINTSSGDMVIWNAYTPHASPKNETSYPRMTYMNGYARADACLEGVWPDYLVGGQSAEVDTATIPYK